jgi:hypothetical protein
MSAWVTGSVASFTEKLELPGKVPAASCRSFSGHPMHVSCGSCLNGLELGGGVACDPAPPRLTTGTAPLFAGLFLQACPRCMLSPGTPSLTHHRQGDLNVAVVKEEAAGLLLVEE